VLLGVFSSNKGVTLPAMVSGMAMSMSSVTVVLSSLLLQWYRKPSIHFDGSLSSPSPVSDLIDQTPYTSTDNLFETPQMVPKSIKSRLFQTFSFARGKNYTKLGDEQV
jgi:hypothetical protein